MKSGDLGSGIFWLLISLWVIFESTHFGFGKLQAPGAGFVPFWSGVALASLSIFLMGLDIFKKSPMDKENGFAEIRWGKWGLILAVLFGYALLLETLGFILCTLFFMIVLLRFVEPQRWLPVLLVALITTGASYLIFQLWLKSQLPRGFLGI